MGDPKKQRKKYSTPIHPWQRTRIEEEAKLVKEYGFSNKKEIWKMDSLHKNISDQIKEYIARTDANNERKKLALIKKLQKLSLIKESATVDDILGICLRDILERRLQTMVVRKGLARSMKQSRQFIVHKHIHVGNREVSVPSYLVKVDEEPTITFSPNSSISSPEHPERVKHDKQ